MDSHPLAGGPLEAKLREGKSDARYGALAPPEALDLIAKSPSPVWCLLAANAAEDAEQQRTLAPLIETLAGGGASGRAGLAGALTNRERPRRRAAARRLMREEVKGTWPGVTATWTVPLRPTNGAP